MKVDSELKVYFDRQEQLTVEAGCILCGVRVVVPLKHRKFVLEELCEGHPGIVRMKSLARLHVWWPGIDKEIESVVHNCMACQSVRNKQPPTSLHPWSWPTRPWQRIHLDFAGPFLGSMFLIAVDAHSKWIEATVMTTTTRLSLNYVRCLLLTGCLSMLSRITALNLPLMN